MTHLLSLKFESSFGRIDNPLWQVADLSSKDAVETPWTSLIIPYEAISDEQIEKFLQNSNAINFQTFLSTENLTQPYLIKILQSQCRLQIWIDRIVNPEEAEILKELLTSYQNLDLVYLPDLHFHPEEVFQNLEAMPRLLVHLKVKENNFDRWLSPFELWERLCWLKENSRIKILGTQLLESQLSSIGCVSKELFFLKPSYENLMNYLKAQEKPHYFFQSLIHYFVQYSTNGTILFVRQLCWAIVRPTTKKWYSLFSYLKYKWIIFYPFRKIYWFLAYQFKKRILKVYDEPR